jgi:hypothetical protein
MQKTPELSPRGKLGGESPKGLIKMYAGRNAGKLGDLGPCVAKTKRAQIALRPFRNLSLLSPRLRGDERGGAYAGMRSSLSAGSRST